MGIDGTQTMFLGKFSVNLGQVLEGRGRGGRANVCQAMLCPLLNEFQKVGLGKKEPLRSRQCWSWFEWDSFQG